MKNQSASWRTKSKIINKFKKNVLLKNYTTFKIGGPAKYFFIAKNKNSLIEAVKYSRKKKLPFFILGGGSNLLVSDKGFDGLVIKMKNEKCKLKNENAKFKIICAEAGVKLSALVDLSIKEGLSGLEWAAGIPQATVGGAIYGNAGAFDNFMENITETVQALEVREGCNLKFKDFNKEECQFGKKETIFKKQKKFIIISAILRLEKRSKEEIQDKIDYILNYRETHHPMNLPSAGSIFKNFTPYRNEVSGAGPEELKELKKFKKTGVIPVALLIEKCGLKGKRIGQAEVSQKHANFIVNSGDSLSADVLELINLIKKKVKNKFGIKLEGEISILSKSANRR